MVKLTPPDLSNREALAIEQGRALAKLTYAQHGVVARRQLVALGLSQRAIDWRLRSTRLRPIHRGVYAVGHFPLSRRGHWLAAVLAHGEGAVLSHVSAASLWGLQRQRGPVDVTSPSGRPGRRGIRLHRGGLERDEWTIRDGIPTTTVARTLIDLAQTTDASRVRNAWEEADRLSLLQLGSVESVCSRAGARRGIRTIRALLAEASTMARTRSPLEDRFLAFCRDHDLPSPVINVHVLGHEVDALWPATRLAVELDSFEFHRHRAAFERDRARDISFMTHGYRVIRVTDRQLDREAGLLAEQLRSLLGIR